ncbi:MAG: Rrf2 family transcriptional regulator [Sulfuricella sp.]|nr:Rrf2 family transcriptional regulator [Sulfuricella sp.]
MRLTRYSDYALRVLLYLAANPERLSTINEIATYHSISRNHLMKVVHQLGSLGYIDTLRGKGGGIRLAHKPSEIVVGDVIRNTEENMEIVECFTPGNSTCVILPGCHLKNALNEALESFLATLDLYTLADFL